MIQFSVLKKSNKSFARLGILKTPHGEVETPSLVPVATSAVVKTLTSEEVANTKTQILIANTYHLHLKPHESIIHASGGIHEFMNWQHPLMTDSGGFQVFSLGFGHDLKVGKILKYFPDRTDEIIHQDSRPKALKITDEGVHFRSPIDGAKIFIGPEESILIQEKLGADIFFSFDECTAPLSSIEYVKSALERTHIWAKCCITKRKGNQALFGIVQGSKYKNLRVSSARFINSLDFDGFGIGGDLGESKSMMEKILGWTIPELDDRKPRHLLGIGYLEDIEPIIQSGVDLFDCTVPTHYARRGIAFTGKGALDLGKINYLKETEPLDPTCMCSVCSTYKRNYISHLIRAKEITGMKLLTFHNLYFFNTYIANIRSKIKRGEI